MGILFEIVIQHLAEQEKEARQALAAEASSKLAEGSGDQAAEESTEQPVC